jgi:hypothetical protein
VVSADQGDAIGIADFEAKKEEEGFERVEAAVDKVAYKELVMAGAESGEGSVPMKR